jgi:hypothetical protein
LNGEPSGVSRRMRVRAARLAIFFRMIQGRRAMFRSIALTASLLLLAGAATGEAQVVVHRPNPNHGVNPNRSTHTPFGVTHFSAQPIYPTRFHAAPIYPRTTFWSNEYPNMAVPAYSLGDLGNLGGPLTYPGTDIPFGRPDFDAQIR